MMRGINMIILKKATIKTNTNKEYFISINETVLKSVSKEKIINFEKTNLTHEQADKKKE